MRPARTGWMALMLVSVVAGCGTPGGAPSTPSPSPGIHPAPSPTPSPHVRTRTPQPSATPRRPTPTARVAPTATPSPEAFEPPPLWVAAPLTPNWLIFQPERPSPESFGLEPVFWFTNGVEWEGPFPLPESWKITEADEESVFPLMRRQGEFWMGCLNRKQCLTRLSFDAPVPRQPLHAEYQTSALTPVVRLELPAGWSWPAVEIPNPWRGTNPCKGLVYKGECQLRIGISGFPGDPALLMEIWWDADFDPDEPQIPNPEYRLMLLEPDSHRIWTLIQAGMVNYHINYQFSPDGRFLLINRLAAFAGNRDVLIFRWPEGDGVAQGSGAALWLQPEGEAPKP